MKVREAKHFLDQLVGTWSNSQAGYHFSAFASAARSITFTLQAVCDDVPGFEEWYADQRAALAANRESRFLLDARNETQKVGVSPLKYSGVVTSAAEHDEHDRFHCRRVYRFTALDDAQAALPEREAVLVCRDHLARVAAVVATSYRRLRPALDPDGSLTQEVAKVTHVPQLKAGPCPLAQPPFRQD
jgi:hypothetical protein